MTNRILRGKITVHPRGFGFVVVEGDREPTSAFVAPPLLNGFFDGDVVDASVEPSGPGRLDAKELRLVERKRTEVFGTVAHHGARTFLRVDRLVGNTDLPLETGGTKLADGVAAVGRLQEGGLVLSRTIEGPDVSIERVVSRHEIPASFPKEVVSAAEKVAPRLGTRRDLRDLPTVTIDAITSRDLDDALSVHPAGDDGAIRVVVSIADVDAFVPEGSPIDVEARRRGTSVYLAGRVLPMLPEVLSNEGISLNQGLDRPAMTAELRIDVEGNVTAVDVYESLIRSHARLTYDAVAAFFDGDEGAIPAAVRETVRWLRTAAARLSIFRRARGGVEVLREEASISFDPVRKEPTAIASRVDDEAHRLVERVMVAANEAIARWLVDRGLPGMFRVHPQPEPARVTALAAFARRFGIEAGFGPILTPRSLAAFDAQIGDSPRMTALRMVMSRVLGPARYTVHRSVHFGLAAPLYLHFTSPIRRYPDLVVHRIVKRYLAGQRRFDPTDPAVEQLASGMNDLAHRAAKAEAESVRMIAARLYASRVGEKVQGRVVRVQPFGLVVSIEGAGVTGTIGLDALGEGARVDLAREEIVVKDGSFAIGDAIACEIAGANEELGRIDLVLAT